VFEWQQLTHDIRRPPSQVYMLSSLPLLGIITHWRRQSLAATPSEGNALVVAFLSLRIVRIPLSLQLFFRIGTYF